jgi:serine/threonine protein kinase
MSRLCNKISFLQVRIAMSSGTHTHAQVVSNGELKVANAHPVKLEHPASSSTTTTATTTASSTSTTPSQAPAVVWPTFKEAKMMHDTQFVVEDCYTIIRTLGHGSNGTVVLAQDSRSSGCGCGSRSGDGVTTGTVVSTGRQVAIKKMKVSWDSPEDCLRMLREIMTLQQFANVNIVRLLDVFTPKPNVGDVYLVFEAVATDLHKVLYSRQPLSEDHTRFFAFQALKALKLVHKAGYVHRDIKPSNFLIEVRAISVTLHLFTLKNTLFAMHHCVSDLCANPKKHNHNDRPTAR